jgi:hypothetical protein
MQNLSPSVYIIFGADFLLGRLAIHESSSIMRRPVLVIITLWTILQSAAGLSGFYSDIHTMTGRFPLLAFPPLIFSASPVRERRKGRVLH